MKVIKKILIILHVIILTIALLAFCSEWFFNFGFIGEIDFVINLSVLITGLIAFFFHLKPMSPIIFYFSTYAAGASMILWAVVFRGLIGAILFSIVMFFIQPKPLEFQQGNIKLYDDATGFMSGCCGYDVREVKMDIFEKNHGSFGSGGHVYFKKTRIVNQAKEVHIYYFLEDRGDNKISNEKKVVIKK